VQPFDTRDDLISERRFEVHAVAVEELLRRCIVAFSLDALHLGQQPSDAVSIRDRNRSSR